MTNSWNLSIIDHFEFLGVFFCELDTILTILTFNIQYPYPDFPCISLAPEPEPEVDDPGDLLGGSQSAGSRRSRLEVWRRPGTKHESHKDTQKMYLLI